MSDEVVQAIAKTITVHTDNNVYAEAIIPESLVASVPQSSLKSKPVISGTKLTWYGADAIYTVEALWPLIQSEQSISLTFAQTYARAWTKLQQTYSTMQVQKMLPEAVIPARAHPLDSGFDITVIRVVNPNYGPGVVLFGTGLIIRPPDGYYIDMVARSSTSKLGWGIANAVGIIDAQYRGELCVPMFKLSPEAGDLELPARVAQIIVRRLEMTDIEEVENAGDTHRGANGFGSSGR